MSEFYTSILPWGNNLLVRGVKDGERYTKKEKFKPTLFVKSNKPTDSKWKSLYGETLVPLYFDEMKEAKEFLQQYKDVDDFPIYGNAGFNYQYISKTYPKDVPYQLKHIKIVSLDIEVASEEGFPDPTSASEEVLLITIKDRQTKKKITFGSRPFDVSTIKHFDSAGYEYVKCKNEIDLLTTFLNFWHNEIPDIITGWYVQSFDIPYLVNRITRILPENSARNLSPWKNVSERMITINGREIQTYDIQGVSQLDYMDLYKKFIPDKPENYKLDTITKLVLKKGKLENPYASHKEFYTKDWPLYVEYNVVDTERVDQLEAKLRLIELIITMAYDAKCNYNDVFSPVRMWDCILYNYMLDHNIAPPQPKINIERTIEGAYVKIPAPGKYRYIVSVDATSMYPSTMMQYNMSPETLVKMRTDITVNGMVEGSYDLSELKETNHTMTANGAIFRRDKKGMIPTVVQKVFDERLFNKKKQLDAEAEYERTKDENLKNDIARYENIQKAKKTQLVSLYGATANPYFRFYDARIAEGITMTGQYMIRYISQTINEYLNKICGTEDVEFVFYNDTDSCYVHLAPLIDKMFPNEQPPPEKIIDVMDAICKDNLNPVIAKACNRLGDYTNAFENKLEFKRELLCDVGIWSVKKRYALSVWDKEGVRYKQPEIKVTGLQSKSTTTPELVRGKLKDVWKLCLSGKEDQLHEFVLNFEKEFDLLPPEDVAFPKGVNGIDKYGDTKDIYKKGTPIHVRGSLLYNHWIKQKKLIKEFELIREGDKIKYVYLREPNPIGENVIAFPSVLPKALELHEYIDYTTQFEKTFIGPIDAVAEGIKWSARPKSNLLFLFED